jgi:site-specific DNA recombinase
MSGKCRLCRVRSLGTPSHSKRDGVRYRYYVSHVLRQRRKTDADRVVRVPGNPAGKARRRGDPAKPWLGTEPKAGLSDREVIDQHVTRIILRPDSIDIELREPTPAPALSLVTEMPVTANVAAAASTCTTVISLPWSAPTFASVKGVLHQPEARPTLTQETRRAILLAVAKARSRIDGIVSGAVRSFAEIAEREGKVERHIRLLTPLAFIPPQRLAAIIDGPGRHDVTVTALAQAVPYRWDGNPANQVSEQMADSGR